MKTFIINENLNDIQTFNDVSVGGLFLSTEGQLCKKINKTTYQNLTSEQGPLGVQLIDFKYVAANYTGLCSGVILEGLYDNKKVAIVPKEVFNNITVTKNLYYNNHSDTLDNLDPIRTELSKWSISYLYQNSVIIIGYDYAFNPVDTNDNIVNVDFRIKCIFSDLPADLNI